MFIGALASDLCFEFPQLFNLMKKCTHPIDTGSSEDDIERLKAQYLKIYEKAHGYWISDLQNRFGQTLNQKLTQMHEMVVDSQLDSSSFGTNIAIETLFFVSEEISKFEAFTVRKV
jgi:hypothetical protein